MKMKKMIIGVAMLLFANVGFGQISDNAVIPVSVTLNSILRLTVESGGNIQFVVNTIEDYSSGIAYSTKYATLFNVASSRDFDVRIYSESDQLYGMNFDGTTTSNAMALDNIGFAVASAGTATGTTVSAGVQSLKSTVASILAAVDAGSSDVNKFRIEWRLGTGEGDMETLSLLEQSFAPDTYVTNVFINVLPL